MRNLLYLTAGVVTGVWLVHRLQRIWAEEMEKR